MKNNFIVMSRVPKPGKTKTRLMARLTPLEACQVHLFILSKISQSVGRLLGKQYLFYTGGSAKELPDIIPDSFLFQPQRGNDLGERMNNAFKYVFEQEGGRVVMVGSDIPLLTAAHFHQAAAGLEQADLVLGPNYDGGYYLIGMKEYWPELFWQRNWGTDQVLAGTLKTAEELGLKVKLLSYELDLDTYEDMVELVDYLARDEERKRLWQDVYDFFTALISR